MLDKVFQQLHFECRQTVLLFADIHFKCLELYAHVAKLKGIDLGNIHDGAGGDDIG